MKSSPQRHSPSNATPHRVHISSVIAQKLSQIGDNTVFDSDNHISVREWRGESRLQRYIVNDSGPESFLVPV
ncbi:hypothetical protein H6768_05420 [Candidatus Peribacteria bacterium]|nr:hypothetical protein [Candidatus Peribacteria bacterium]